MRLVSLILVMLLLLIASVLLASAEMGRSEIVGHGACWICPVCGYEIGDPATGGGEYIRAHPWTLCPVCKLAYYWHFYQSECNESELNETVDGMRLCC